MSKALVLTVWFLGNLLWTAVIFVLVYVFWAGPYAVQVGVSDSRCFTVNTMAHVYVSCRFPHTSGEPYIP